MFMEDNPGWGVGGGLELPQGLREFLAESERRREGAAEDASGCAEHDPQTDRAALPEEVGWQPVVRYSAAFRQSSADELQCYGMPFEDYGTIYDLLWPAGWRLKHLRPYAQGGTTYYTAVWKKSLQAEIQGYGLTDRDYRDKYDYLFKLGWRLKILSPYQVVEGDRDVTRYAAVWQPSNAGEIQLREMPYATYRERYDELSAQGWRLKALSVHHTQRALYTAVWEPSRIGETQICGVPYAGYRDKHDELAAQGWRLKLLVPYHEGTATLYTAVWAKGTLPEIQIHDASAETFRAKYAQLYEQGWRLKLIEPHRAWVQSAGTLHDAVDAAAAA